MTIVERVVEFECDDERLVGIASTGGRIGPVGVVIVVGGPQYRVGSHRQFVLLARGLAERGVPVFRFDQRGMGDASGPMVGFERIDRDIRCAIDAFVTSVPAVRSVVLWGLCDGASAALMYSFRDERVSGLVLLNPWVRDTQVQAITHIKHYYRSRLFSRDLWRKLLRGDFAWRRFISEFRHAASAARGPRSPSGSDVSVRFQDRMLDALQRFRGRTLVVLSENDLTAREFEEFVSRDPTWGRRLAAKDVRTIHVSGADHTFSTSLHRRCVETMTSDWIETDLLPDASR